MTPLVKVQGAVFVEPFSNPGLPMIWVVVPPVVIVSEMVVLCETPPPLALIVIVDVPAAAVLLAVKVRVELPEPGAAMDVGLNAAVTPEGSPLAESDTAELKPPEIVVEIVLVPELPAATERLVGDALTEKSGVAVAETVRETVVLCETPPPLALIVIVDVPVAAVLLAVNVSVELPEPGAAMDAGLKLAVTPAGNPLAESDTAELKPPDTVVETVVVLVPPCTTDTVVGDALRAKSGVCVPGLKITSRTGCSSIPLGATPVCPCRKSNIPTPLIWTGMLAVWKLVVAVNLALNSFRALVMPARNGLPAPTHDGEGISTIMVSPLAS